MDQNDKCQNCGGSIPFSRKKGTIYFLVQFAKFFIMTSIIIIFVDKSIPISIYLIFAFIYLLVAYIITEYEKSKLKSINESHKINSYLDDNFIEVRENKLFRKIFIDPELGLKTVINFN